MPEALVRLGRMGYDGVELWQQYLEQADLSRLAGLLAQNGLAALQLCPYFDLVTSDRTVEDSVRLNERFVEMARQLQGDRIRVFTGPVDEKDATPEQYRRCVRGLRRLCDHGGAQGVDYVLEVQHGVMQTSAGILRLIGDVDRPNVLVNLQLPLRGESWEESVSRLGRHVQHLHAHNWSTREGDFKALTYLGQGVMDFEAFIRALVGNGFDGVISIEHPTRPDTDDPLVVAGKEAEYLKGLLQRMGGDGHG